MANTPENPAGQASAPAQGQAQEPTVQLPQALVAKLFALALKRPDILQRLAQMYAQHATQQQQGAAGAPGQAAPPPAA